MATTNKTSEKKKEAPKSKEAEKSTPVKTEAPKTGSSKSNGQTIAIVILSAVLVFVILIFTVLSLTGVIKFGGGNEPQVAEQQDSDDRDDHKNDGRDSDAEPIDDNVDYSPQKGDIISNPNKQVKESNATLVHVGDLEFYLPRQFKYGGKNKDGAMTYNLEDDDGWASVSVYAEKSSLSPARYLNKVSSYLEVTDTDYRMNGTSWVQAETGSTLAYATKLDGKVYAVYYAVKLDSDATSKAMQMIPKTLYMQKIVKE